MDKDEFLQWKDSPATQWVLAYLQEVSQRVRENSKEQWFQSASLPAAEWASLQAQTARDLGYVAAIQEMINLEHEDIEQERNPSD